MEPGQETPQPPHPQESQDRDKAISKIVEYLVNDVIKTCVEVHSPVPDYCLMEYVEHSFNDRDFDRHTWSCTDEEVAEFTCPDEELPKLLRKLDGKDIEKIVAMVNDGIRKYIEWLCSGAAPRERRGCTIIVDGRWRISEVERLCEEYIKFIKKMEKKRSRAPIQLTPPPPGGVVGERNI